MSRKGVLLVVTVLACVATALAVWIIGSLDREGSPHLGIDPLIAALLFIPYVLIAGVAAWNRQRGIVIAACLLTLAAIAALAIPIQWSDYDSWRQTPPGREVQRMAILQVLFVQWVGSGLLLILAVGYRLVTARRQAPYPMQRIAPLMLALGLSIAAMSCSRTAEPSTAEAPAIAEIKKLGGRVVVDEKSPGKPAIAVDFTQTTVADAGLVNLKALAQLQQLDLGITRVTDAGLVNLSGLTQLQKLNLHGTCVTDAGMVNLKGLAQLQELDIGLTAVTDAGLKQLKGLTQLQELNLFGVQLTDAGLVNLKGLARLQKLDIGVTAVTDAGLVNLKDLTQLQELSLFGTRVTDAGLEHLWGLTQLQDLNLISTQGTDAGGAKLQQALPKCKIVWR